MDSVLDCTALSSRTESSLSLLLLECRLPYGFKGAVYELLELTVDDLATRRGSEKSLAPGRAVKPLDAFPLLPTLPAVYEASSVRPEHELRPYQSEDVLSPFPIRITCT